MGLDFDGELIHSLETIFKILALIEPKRFLNGPEELLGCSNGLELLICGFLLSCLLPRNQNLLSFCPMFLRYESLVNENDQLLCSQYNALRSFLIKLSHSTS